MNKAFVKESEAMDDPEESGADRVAPLPAGSRNYITPQGHARLMEEFLWLMNTERPQVTATVAWAASNGDRSENADYIYGKKRLRQIDRRIRFLTRRLDVSQIVDPSAPREDETQIFFGATVLFSTEKGEHKKVSIVGVDEIDPARGYISWVSPIGRALIKARVGDRVMLDAPGGTEELEILEVGYQEIPMEDFSPVRGE
jgi:transcription elongation factor GreB